MVDMVFSRLGIGVLIKVNNRKVLTGLAEICGFPDKVVDITVAIDKMEKIGLEKVEEELLERGLSAEALGLLEPVLTLEGTTGEKISVMRKLFSDKDSATGLKGVEELEVLFSLVESAGIASRIEMDLSLARGLNYYTGAIFEVKALDFPIGSICGGGRYDNLTGIFGLPGVSGVGISFGADRIYDVLKGLDKFPSGTGVSTRLLFANMGDAELRYILPVVKALRGRGISVEIYPESAKLRKQFEYAQKKDIPFLSICGADEAASSSVNIKDLASGEQRRFPAEDVDAMAGFIG